jgi:hypothetical protein
LRIAQSQTQTFPVDNDRTYTAGMGAELFSKMTVTSIQEKILILAAALKNDKL